MGGTFPVGDPLALGEPRPLPTESRKGSASHAAHDWIAVAHQAGERNRRPFAVKISECARRSGAHRRRGIMKVAQQRLFRAGSPRIPQCLGDTRANEGVAVAESAKETLYCPRSCHRVAQRHGVAVVRSTSPSATAVIVATGSVGIR